MIKTTKRFTLLLTVLAFVTSCTEPKTKDVSKTTIVKEKTTCLYSFDETAIKVYWAGYKTEDKLKVVGQFKELTTDRTNQIFPSIKALVEGTQFSINTASSNSGDEIRDLSLKGYFFNLFTENFEIEGGLEKMTDDSITANINSFGTVKTMQLSYSITNEVLKMKGTLSIEEFGALKAYNSIHKKCFDLHKGKTWDEVNVIIEVPFLKDCK